MMRRAGNTQRRGSLDNCLREHGMSDVDIHVFKDVQRMPPQYQPYAKSCLTKYHNHPDEFSRAFKKRRDVLGDAKEFFTPLQVANLLFSRIEIAKKKAKFWRMSREILTAVYSKKEVTRYLKRLSLSALTQHRSFMSFVGMIDSQFGSFNRSSPLLTKTVNLIKELGCRTAQARATVLIFLLQQFFYAINADIRSAYQSDTTGASRNNLIRVQNFFSEAYFLKKLLNSRDFNFFKQLFCDYKHCHGQLSHDSNQIAWHINHSTDVIHYFFSHRAYYRSIYDRFTLGYCTDDDADIKAVREKILKIGAFMISDHFSEYRYVVFGSCNPNIKPLSFECMDFIYSGYSRLITLTKPCLPSGPSESYFCDIKKDQCITDDWHLRLRDEINDIYQNLNQNYPVYSKEMELLNDAVVTISSSSPVGFGIKKLYEIFEKGNLKHIAMLKKNWHFFKMLQFDIDNIIKICGVLSESALPSITYAEAQIFDFLISHEINLMSVEWSDETVRNIIRISQCLGNLFNHILVRSLTVSAVMSKKTVYQLDIILMAQLFWQSHSHVLKTLLGLPADNLSKTLRLLGAVYRKIPFNAISPESHLGSFWIKISSYPEEKVNGIIEQIGKLPMVGNGSFHAKPDTKIENYIYISMMNLAESYRNHKYCYDVSYDEYIYWLKNNRPEKYERLLSGLKQLDAEFGLADDAAASGERVTVDSSVEHMVAALKRMDGVRQTDITTFIHYSRIITCYSDDINCIKHMLFIARHHSEIFDYDGGLIKKLSPYIKHAIKCVYRDAAFTFDANTIKVVIKIVTELYTQSAFQPGMEKYFKVYFRPTFVRCHLQPENLILGYFILALDFYHENPCARVLSLGASSLSAAAWDKIFTIPYERGSQANRKLNNRRFRRYLRKSCLSIDNYIDIIINRYVDIFQLIAENWRVLPNEYCDCDWVFVQIQQMQLPEFQTRINRLISRADEIKESSDSNSVIVIDSDTDEDVYGANMFPDFDVPMEAAAPVPAATPEPRGEVPRRRASEAAPVRKPWATPQFNLHWKYIPQECKEGLEHYREARSEHTTDGADPLAALNTRYETTSVLDISGNVVVAGSALLIEENDHANAYFSCRYLGNFNLEKAIVAVPCGRGVNAKLFDTLKTSDRYQMCLVLTEQEYQQDRDSWRTMVSQGYGVLIIQSITDYYGNTIEDNRLGYVNARRSLVVLFAAKHNCNVVFVDDNLKTICLARELFKDELQALIADRADVSLIIKDNNPFHILLNFVEVLDQPVVSIAEYSPVKATSALRKDTCGAKCHAWNIQSIVKAMGRFATSDHPSWRYMRYLFPNELEVMCEDIYAQRFVFWIMEKTDIVSLSLPAMILFIRESSHSSALAKKGVRARPLQEITTNAYIPDPLYRLIVQMIEQFNDDLQQAISRKVKEVGRAYCRIKQHLLTHPAAKYLNDTDGDRTRMRVLQDLDYLNQGRQIRPYGDGKIAQLLKRDCHAVRPGIFNLSQSQDGACSYLDGHAAGIQLARKGKGKGSGSGSRGSSYYRLLVEMPTGAGKSVVIFLTALAYYLHDPSKHVFVCCHSIQMVDQMLSAFLEYTKRLRFKPEVNERLEQMIANNSFVAVHSGGGNAVQKEVLVLQDKMRRETRGEGFYAKIVIICLASLKLIPTTPPSVFDCVLALIYDEAHKTALTGSEARKTLTPTVMCQFRRMPRVFLTATPGRLRDAYKTSLVQRPPYKASIDDVVKEGVILPLRIRQLGYAKAYNRSTGRDFHRVLSVFKEEALLSKKGMLFMNSIDDAQDISQRMQSVVSAEQRATTVYLLTSRNTRAENKKILSQFKANQGGAILCVVDMAVLGMDCPDLYYGFDCKTTLKTKASKNCRDEQLQRSGRLRRKYPGKSDGLMITFNDYLPNIEAVDREHARQCGAKKRLLAHDSGSQNKRQRCQRPVNLR